jgi:hypothetical protein
VTSHAQPAAAPSDERGNAGLSAWKGEYSALDDLSTVSRSSRRESALTETKPAKSLSGLTSAATGKKTTFNATPPSSRANSRQGPLTQRNPKLTLAKSGPKLNR